jgi:hypothetical protein
MATTFTVGSIAYVGPASSNNPSAGIGEMIPPPGLYLIVGVAGTNVRLVAIESGSLDSPITVAQARISFTYASS